MSEVNHGCCILTAKAVAPYIYVIRQGVFIYIGETQRYPFHRWHEHFSELGTFMGKIYERDPEVAESARDVRICWILVSEIENKCAKWEIKRVTQYLEHLLHLELYGRSEIFPKFQIISETKRTAPTRCGFHGIEALASRLAGLLACNIANGT